MGVSDWDLLGLCPVDHAWKRVNRPSRFGFRTFSDGFYVSKFTGGNPISSWWSRTPKTPYLARRDWCEVVLSAGVHASDVSTIAEPNRIHITHSAGLPPA